MGTCTYLNAYVSISNIYLPVCISIYLFHTCSIVPLHYKNCGVLPYRALSTETVLKWIVFPEALTVSFMDQRTHT